MTPPTSPGIRRQIVVWALGGLLFGTVWAVWTTWSSSSPWWVAVLLGLGVGTFWGGVMFLWSRGRGRRSRAARSQPSERRSPDAHPDST